MREVVLRAQYGIDLHTAALHRSNLPQIRIAPDEPELLELAEAFGPPVILVSKLREGTLRQCARDHGVQDAALTKAARRCASTRSPSASACSGILRVMKWLGMIAGREYQPQQGSVRRLDASTWLRAPEGGILRAAPIDGDRVRKGETIGEISDPLGETRQRRSCRARPASSSAAPICRSSIAATRCFTSRASRIPNIAATNHRIGGECEAPLFDEDEII